MDAVIDTRPQARYRAEPFIHEDDSLHQSVAAAIDNEVVVVEEPAVGRTTENPVFPGDPKYYNAKKSTAKTAFLGQ